MSLWGGGNGICGNLLEGVTSVIQLSSFVRGGLGEEYHLDLDINDWILLWGEKKSREVCADFHKHIITMSKLDPQQDRHKVIAEVATVGWGASGWRWKTDHDKSLPILQNRVVNENKMHLSCL